VGGGEVSEISDSTSMALSTLRGGPSAWNEQDSSQSITNSGASGGRVGVHEFLCRWVEGKSSK
jgi:hypothetical protein